MVGFSYGHQPVKIPPQTRLNMCKLESCRLPIADCRLLMIVQSGILI